MAVTYKAPGTYVLGGISAPSRGTGQAFRAGLTTAQQRREREQAMQLRASAEQRAKEQFEMAKADRARAAAQAAAAAQADKQRKALLAQYGGALVGSAPGLVTGAPGVATQPATAPTFTGPGTDLSFGTTVAPTPTTPYSGRPMVPGQLPAGTPTAGLTVPGAGDTTMVGSAGEDVLAVPTTPYSGRPMVPGQMPAGATRTTYYGTQFDIYPDGRIVNLATGTEIPATPEYADLRATVSAMATGGAAATIPMGVRPTTGQELPEYVDPAGLRTALLGDLPGQANADRFLASGLINQQEYEQLTRGSRGQQREVIAIAVRRQLAGETAPAVSEAPTAPETVTVQTTTPSGEETTVEVDEGPTIAPTAGVRAPDSESPVDYILGQPVGSAATAPNIPRDTPRISAAITQGFSERERLVEAYNAFTQAGLLEDARDFLQAIQNLDQTLIRLQGEQAINDLQIGSVERASQLLSYYYGTSVQPVMTSDGVYDLYINGQPAENEDMLGLRPDQMGNMLRQFFDTQYRDAMAKGREEYLTTRAEKQAERDMAEAENPGFTREFTLEGQAPGGGDLVVMRNEQGEFRLVWFVESADGRLTTDYQALTQEELRTMMTPEQLRNMEL